MDVDKLNFIIKKFYTNSNVLTINKINSGLINKTYIIEHLNNGTKSKFILQSLSNIFESREVVNINHNLITNHIKKKINENHFDFDMKRWEVPYLIRCQSNNLFAFPFETDFWRAMRYVDQTLSFDYLEDNAMAFQTGVGLAKFHSICSDLECSRLKTNITNFHNIHYYIDEYTKSFDNYKLVKLENHYEERIKTLNIFCSKQIFFAKSLAKSLDENLIVKNVIHGDPKLSNFLFDIHHKYVVSMIDLDTVSSGYLLTDLADCIRSICNSSREQPRCLDNVSFDIGSFKSFLNGYFSISDKNDSFRFILEFIYLIIFELTIRFFTDFLQSNRYFRVKYKTQNLCRAEVQCRLLCDFLSHITILSNELVESGIYSSPTFKVFNEYTK